MAEDIQVFSQWQKTSWFSGNGRRHPGFHAVARDNLRRFGRSLSSIERLPCLGGWTLCQLVTITNHQSITITNSQSPITCWTSSWPSLARARCPGRTEPALLLPDQNNDLMTTFILMMMMTLKTIMMINKSLKTFSGLSTKGSATLSTWVPNCPFSRFHLFS